MSTVDARRLLKGVAFPKEWRGIPSKITSSVCKRLRFPLAVKLPQILHKTEQKAVRVVCDWEDLQGRLREFDRIAKKQRLGAYTVLLQEFVKGAELIVGLKKDVTFGHAIMLGLGGVYVEVFKDVTFRVCPITPKDAESMISELKSKKILEGVRGLPKANTQALIRTLVAVSKVPSRYPKVSELDINPLMVNAKGAFAIDVRAVTK
ncbi:acetate--CoA ligase family protein [Candidatus Woesearchaeota archaeon]|nr:acetate--CoA ligase family protein [Candidatus Woesearchaeota archaeon]